MDVDEIAARTQLVVRYCVYGARSQAQFDGCVDHVRPGRILAERGPGASNAIKFAIGRIASAAGTPVRAA